MRTQAVQGLFLSERLKKNTIHMHGTNKQAVLLANDVLKVFWIYPL